MLGWGRYPALREVVELYRKMEAAHVYLAVHGMCTSPGVGRRPRFALRDGGGGATRDDGVTDTAALINWFRAELAGPIADGFVTVVPAPAAYWRIANRTEIGSNNDGNNDAPLPNPCADPASAARLVKARGGLRHGPVLMDYHEAVRALAQAAVLMHAKRHGDDFITNFDADEMLLTMPEAGGASGSGAVTPFPRAMQNVLRHEFGGGGERGGGKAEGGGAARTLDDICYWRLHTDGPSKKYFSRSICFGNRIFPRLN